MRRRSSTDAQVIASAPPRRGHASAWTVAIDDGDALQAPDWSRSPTGSSCGRSSSLRPYERNPRTHSDEQVDQIAASMVEFGWTNPVLVDEQGGILAGHGRLLAASKLGLAEVPVIRFEHLSEAQKRAYLIADNQLALQAGWSEELLAAELAWLQGRALRPRPDRLRGAGAGAAAGAGRR